MQTVLVHVNGACRAQVVLNSLYKQTALQGRFPCNMVALVGGTPQTLTLKQFLQHFLDFRCEVVGRRARCVLIGACHSMCWGNVPYC